MNQIIVIDDDGWFDEYRLEFEAWSDAQVVLPRDLNYQHRDDPNAHYHIWATEGWLKVSDQIPQKRACAITLRCVEQVPVLGTFGSAKQAEMFQQFCRVAPHADLLVTSCRTKQACLQRILPSQSVQCVPIGSASTMGAPDFGVTQDIDVLIYGSDVPRRVEFAKAIAAELKDYKVWGVTGGWGEQRNRLMHRAKIVLNIQSQHGLFATMRMWRAFANGVFWVTEEAGDTSPGELGRDLEQIDRLTAANLSSQCARLRAWLHDDGYRDRVRRAGFEKAKRLNMRHFFAQLCSQLSAGR